MRYVALDGPDGSGKSSQAAALVAWLAQRGRRVLHVREPGSTPVGEALRELLLAPATGELALLTEVLLFSAARAELVARVIAPALARGELVVAERSWLSTAVYQLDATPSLQRAAADREWFEDLTRRVHGGCLPDRVFVLDVPPAVAAARRSQRTHDRFEARDASYQLAVREGFLSAAAREPRARVIDASRSFADVQAELRAALAGVPA